MENSIANTTAKITTFDTYTSKDLPLRRKIIEEKIASKRAGIYSSEINIFNRGREIKGSKKEAQISTRQKFTIYKMGFDNNAQHASIIRSQQDGGDVEGSDKEINNMTLQLSESSLVKVWDNEEDSFWDEHYKKINK